LLHRTKFVAKVRSWHAEGDQKGLVDLSVAAHRGRIVKTTGDGIGQNNYLTGPQPPSAE
jgi:hypothetical protein